MKIAITADVHLTSRDKNPERYHALENILDQLVDLNIDTLIIAGDLFDSTCKTPGEFEGLIQNQKYAYITIYIIPGNHDPVLSQGAFILQNIKYLTKLELVEFSNDACFLFQPYVPNLSIGEALAACPFELKPNTWVLVAHGDNLTSSRLRNTYEKGVYMPLSGRDIIIHQPKKVFLGHIHACMDALVVHYPGSPCGLDPTETGIRSFLTYDTSNGKVERIPVETDLIYIQESLTVLPLVNEVEYVRQILEKKIATWNLDESRKRKTLIRINIQGFSTNRERLSTTIVAYLTQQGYLLEEKPDLAKVKISTDVMRADIAEAVQKHILEMELPENDDEPTKDEYILAAMNQIYRG